MSNFATVLPDKTVLLGAHVCCDGSDSARPVSVVSHAHSDHLELFETALGRHNSILLTPATYELLLALKGSYLEIRRNLIRVEYYEPFRYRDEVVTLFPSDHMLGSAQVLVVQDDGTRITYTGDFDTTAPVIPTDTLVIDATYGNPDYERQYNKDQVMDEFQSIVSECLGRFDAVAVKAHFGRLQFAMEILRAVHPNVVFILSERQAALAAVYERFGCDLQPYVSEVEFRPTARQRHIFFYTLNEKRNSIEDLPRVTLTNHFFPKTEPIRQIGETRWLIAVTDHAEFRATAKYIDECGAKRVIVDSSRGGDGPTLARWVRENLGIEATVGGVT